MAANTAPIFSLLGDINWGATAITTANTAKDGTGTVLNVFTADATNGGFVQRIRFRSAGTNIATVARVFINNGSTNATAANNILYDEITLAATTLSEVSALTTYELPLNFALPPGYTLNVTIGTTIAAGYFISVIGGKY
jgi:hypothetical protein